MEESSLDKKILKKFGITMGVVFSIITFFILIRHKYSILPTSIISVIFFISAFMMSVLLKPIYIFWMKLAFILSWINTGLILFIIFYLIFTPIGLGMRLFGADLLDKKIDKHKKSYWKEKKNKEFSPLDYEKQF
jgi:membrane-associated phospholipid phosphatase